MTPGDLVWVRAAIVKETPNALLIALQGPGGNPVTYAIDPKSPMFPVINSGGAKPPEKVGPA